jgi:hypothetical protein
MKNKQATEMYTPLNTIYTQTLDNTHTLRQTEQALLKPFMNLVAMTRARALIAIFIELISVSISYRNCPHSSE